MKYVPPVGGADNDPYVDGNPAGGIEGSPVPAAAIEHPMREILNIILAAGLVPSAADLGQLSASVVKRLAQGKALPTSNFGPIWHDDYNSLMTWQAFTANGADYTGYASVFVGNLLIDTQPTPRAGYVRSGVTNLSRTAYAALRGWAMHNGIMVASGTWAAGTIAVKDNTDGTTFTVFDVRGEFPRFWDDARGVDSGRVFGSSQVDEFKQHKHTTDVGTTLIAASGTDQRGAGGGVYTGLTGGSETRPRNTAFLAAIKF